MGRDWNSHYDDFSSSPGRAFRKVLAWVILLSIGFGVTSYALGWFSEAGQVAKGEFGPRASLKKYEWFKDCSESIEEKKHTINVYEKNISNMDGSYSGLERRHWDRLDKQQYNVWTMEITGLKASYNKIVKEYNAQSSKFNWSMYNTSDLPESYDLYLDN